jgi:hypothetical protein
MSHGKDTCDGIGETIKRLAGKASLHNPYEEQIVTTEQIYEWSIAKILSVTFE